VKQEIFTVSVLSDTQAIILDRLLLCGKYLSCRSAKVITDDLSRSSERRSKSIGLTF